MSTHIGVAEDTLPNILTCPTGYTAMCSISGTGSNLCGCYWPHIPSESWAPVKPFNFTCVDPLVSTCSEGQYFCSSENICKPAGQSCGAATCYNNTPVSWTQFNNPSPANINSPSAASLGSASGSIQLGTKNIQVSYAGDVRSVGIADNWSWVWTNNTAPFLSTLVSNIPNHAHLL